MSWAASTHLREILSNMIAVAFPDSDEDRRSERVNHAAHELRRYLDWQEGWRPSGRYPNGQISVLLFHKELEHTAKLCGENCSASWDGEEFDWETHVNRLEDKLLDLVSKPLKGAR